MLAQGHRGGLFRVEETKTGVPLELPVTRQLGEILARRRAEGNALPEDLHGWVFPSRSSVSGHVEELQALAGDALVFPVTVETGCRKRSW